MEWTCGVLLILGLLFTFYQPTTALPATLGRGISSADKTYKVIWTGNTTTPFTNQAEAETQCLTLTGGGTLAVIDNREVLQDLMEFLNKDKQFAKVDRNAKYYVNGKKATDGIAFQISGSGRRLPYHNFGTGAVDEITGEVCIYIEKGNWNRESCGMPVATHAFCQTTPDVCTPELCLNGGTCSPDGATGFTCACPPGFSGERCDIRIPCSISPCQNDGTCISNVTGAESCKCTPEFSGKNCETPNMVHTPCSGVTCSNGGTCIVNNDAPYCICDIGYTGNLCEDDVCTSELCLNGGTCSPDGTCACPPGFSGETCDIRIPCSISPCQNGGICVSDVTGVESCKCTPEFSGENCETQNEIPCSISPCQNGGTCVSDVTGAESCKCTAEFSGENCDTQSDVCTPEPCLNSGTCSPDGATGFTCACPPGFSGERCDIRSTRRHDQG